MKTKKNEVLRFKNYIMCTQVQYPWMPEGGTRVPRWLWAGHYGCWELTSCGRTGDALSCWAISPAPTKALNGTSAYAWPLIWYVVSALCLLQPHLPAVSDNINEVTFHAKDYDRMTAVISREGEKIMVIHLKTLLLGLPWRPRLKRKPFTFERWGCGE